MKQKLKRVIKILLKKFGLNRTDIEKKLLKLQKELILENIEKNNKKILFTHSFGIYNPSYTHDKIMAFTLSLRGFDIYATFCDGIQDIECNVYGGVWGGGDNFQNNCKNCQNRSKELWDFINPDNIFKYSNYLKKEDYLKIDNILKNVTDDEWVFYKEDNFDVGFWAKDILVNNYVVADYKLIENYNILGKSHLKNLLLCKIASERIIKDIKPDRIISNDSYYGMWKIWELLAKKQAVPFYSHWSGTRVGGWAYSYNDAVMNLNFSPSWEKYSNQALTEDEKVRIEKWLKERVNGKEMIMDTASISSYKDEEFDLTLIDPVKPTALLSANVVWDLAALNKEVFSKNMADWIIQTIKWFQKNPQYQLIIKSHPAEYFPCIPETKETVVSMILKEFIEIPKNVFLLSAKVSISVYDLLPLSKVGLVFTTSVGMEMAARGFPVITAGKSHYRGYGFTVDPNSVDEYFKFLEKYLSGEYLLNKEKIIDLAQKFIKFNFFHYFVKHNLIEFKIDGGSFSFKLKLNIDNIKDLKKGQNEHFDYIVDAIELGKPILDKNRWMKESL